MVCFLKTHLDVSFGYLVHYSCNPALCLLNHVPVVVVVFIIKGR